MEKSVMVFIPPGAPLVGVGETYQVTSVELVSGNYTVILKKTPNKACTGLATPVQADNDSVQPASQ